MSTFSSELIKIDYWAKDKKSCLSDAVKMLATKGIIDKPEVYLEKLLEREEIMSTGIGRRIAIPHLRDSAVREFKAAIYLLDNEIDFNSIDKVTVKLIIVFAIPDESGDKYMKLIGSISGFLRDKENREMVMACRDKVELLRKFRRIENEAK